MRGKVGIDAYVGDDDTCADLSREHVDRRTAAQEVEHHLSGHLARISTHTFGRDTMVGRQRENDSRLQWGIDPTCNAGEPHREILEPPEAARGLGQPRLTRGSESHRSLVQRQDRHAEVR